MSGSSAIVKTIIDVDSALMTNDAKLRQSSQRSQRSRA
jgi:hypothetical protein